MVANHVIVYAIGNLTFCACFRLDWRFVKRISWGYRSISEKTLGAEYPGFTANHPVVDRF